jgi:hypothetical protein
METDRTAKYGLYRDLVTIRPTTYRPPGRIPDAVDADDYPPMVPPPWSRPDHDVLADVMRAMQVIALIPPPPPPEVRAGSDQVFKDLADESGIESRAGGAETLGMLGIPVRVTNELPENVIIIGDRVLIRRGIGDWITFPLSALEYDADVTAQPARTYRAP